MKPFRIIPYLVVFTLSLLLSRQISLAVFHPSIKVNPTMMNLELDQANAEPVLDTQVNILLIHAGYPDNPELTSVWWVAIAPHSPITLIPVYPSVQMGETEINKITDVFLTNKKGTDLNQLSPTFIKYLQENSIPWDGFLILDHSALEILVNFVGGVKIGESILEGKEVIAGVSSLERDPLAAMEFQTELWNSLCQKVIFAGSMDNFQIIQPDMVKHTTVSQGFPITFTTFQTHISKNDVLYCAVNPGLGENSQTSPRVFQVDSNSGSSNGN
jgi:hypothetical protein